MKSRKSYFDLRWISRALPSSDDKARDEVKESTEKLGHGWGMVPVKWCSHDIILMNLGVMVVERLC